MDADYACAQKASLIFLFLAFEIVKPEHCGESESAIGSVFSASGRAAHIFFLAESFYSGTCRAGEGEKNAEPCVMVL